MIRALRERFNQNWSPDQYGRLRAALTERAGVPLSFPVCETPCFFPRPLIDQMTTTAATLVESFLANADARARIEREVPGTTVLRKPIQPEELQRAIIVALRAGSVN